MKRKRVTCKASAAKPLGLDPQFCLASHYHAEDSRGYSDHTIVIRKGLDGHLSFSEPGSDGGFIYLYPEQVKHLRRVLKARVRR